MFFRHFIYTNIFNTRQIPMKQWFKFLDNIEQNYLPTIKRLQIKDRKRKLQVLHTIFLNFMESQNNI